MKVGVLSDTHDRLTTFRRAVALFKRQKVDALFHAGDFVSPFAAKLIVPPDLPMPLHCVYGNNDGERQGLKTLLPGVVDGPLHVTISGKRVVMHHWIESLSPADTKSADVVITGHTHEVVNETRDGTLLLNPGECCGWVTDRGTVAILDLDAVKAQIIEIHE